MVTRREARELLLNTLFQQDFREVDVETYIQENGFSDDFITDTLRGIQQHLEQLNDLIRNHAKGWTLERLVSVDRNILRLGLYELLYTDTPHEIIINEAVELAKRFGTEHSASFVNGILDQVWKQKTNPIL